jgi:hypothetical protein
VRPADGDRDVEARDRRRGDGGAQPLGRARGALALGVGQDRHELVPAPAGELVAAAPGALEPAGHFGEHLVPDLVAAAVVYRLEVIHVDPDEPELAPVADAERDGALELVRPVAPVREPGELVRERLLGEPRVRLDERVVERLHAQGGVHARVELRTVERRAQHIVRAAPQRVHGVLVARQQEHGHAVEAVVGAQPVEHPAEPRVDQDRVRAALGDERDRLLLAVGPGQLVRARAEPLRERVAEVRGGGDDEQQRGHRTCVTDLRA